MNLLVFLAYSKPDRLLVTAFLAMMAYVSVAFADDHIKTANIALYQPNSVLAERKVNPKDLAAYIQKLTKVVEAEIGTNAAKEALDVVVAVRPGKKSKIWFVSSLKSPTSRKALADKLVKVTPVEVTGGLLAFSISLNIAKATRTGKFEPPMPAEWIAAAKRKGDSVRIEEIINAAWGESK